jgi:glycosyltransferase 2 family protein
VNPRIALSTADAVGNAMVSVPARRWARFYSSPRGGATSRRATDVVILAAALAGLALFVAAYPPGQLEGAFASFLASVPGWLDPVWDFLYDLVGFWAILLLLSVAVSRRGMVLLQALAALVLAAGLAIVCTRLAVGHWPDVGLAIRGGSGAPSFPAIRLAEAGAVTLTVGAQLVRGLQRTGRWVLFLGFVGSLLVHPATPSGSLAAILVAVAATAAARLLFGTSLGRPGIDDVARALRELGVDAVALQPAEEQVSGVFRLEAADPEGRPLVVKIYGRNAYDTQLLATFWRTLWYQDRGPAPGLSRVQAVEREALAALLATRAGVPTQEVVKAGATVAGDALLVLRGAARPLAEVGAKALGREQLGRFWNVLADLRNAGIAHQELDPSTVAIVGGEAGLLDFGKATITGTADQLMTDSAQLLATTSAVAGTARAIEAASDALGQDGVASLLPYLQVPAFGGALRTALKEAGVDVDELRASAATVVGAEEPQLVRLRRVTWGSLLQVGLLVLAVTAIVRVAGNIDFAAVRHDLSNATWGWLVFAFLFAQVPRLTQTLSTLGSISAQLRFGPLYILQLATSYLNLALPSSVARMTVTIRFFQRQGLPPAAAVTAGAIDSVAGNAIQAVLVLLLVLFSSADVPLDLQAPSGGMLRLAWILLALVVGAVLVVALVGRLRRAIVGRLRVWWPQVTASLGALRASNKLVLLIGGNIATEVLFATALGLAARGFGAHIPLTELIVINSGTSLLSSFIPVPGGIGVVEFALEVGLTSSGMTPSAAAATILVYRLSTFYLPPAWGFFAFRWLQRNRYL